jgi:type IV pilus biogenesis protein CpaD/CtpE
VTASLRIRILLTAASALVLSACAATTPQNDARFGQSVRATLASQVADPAAVRNATPVNGIDGRAALGALQRYEKSFGKAEAAPAASTFVPMGIAVPN